LFSTKEVESEVIFNQDDPDVAHYIFQLRLRIKHRSMPLADIQSKIPLEMRNGWSTGMPRITPTGVVFGGASPDTYWNYSTDVKGRRDFFGFTIDFLDALLKEQSVKMLFQEITDTGGNIGVDIYIAPNANIGDVLDSEQMSFLLRNKISIGVEYFP